MRRALKTSQLLEGAEHPATASVMVMLADILKVEEKFQEAYDAYLEALRLRIATYGPDHRQVGKLHNNLGNLCKYLGRFEEAEQHLTRAIEIAESLDGKDHARVATSLTNLGILLLAEGRPEPALGLFQRATRIFEKQPLGVRSLASTLINASEALLDLHQPQAALAQAQAAVRAVPDTSHTIYPDAVFAQANALWACGQRQLAQAEYVRLEKLLEGRENVLEIQAGAKFGRAKGLMAIDPQQARTLALEARAILAVNPADRKYAQEIDAFLAVNTKAAR